MSGKYFCNCVQPPAVPLWPKHVAFQKKDIVSHSILFVFDGVLSFRYAQCTTGCHTLRTVLKPRAMISLTTVNRLFL